MHTLFTAVCIHTEQIDCLIWVESV